MITKEPLVNDVAEPQCESGLRTDDGSERSRSGGTINGVTDHESFNDQHSKFSMISARQDSTSKESQLSDHHLLDVKQSVSKLSSVVIR